MSYNLKIKIIFCAILLSIAPPSAKAYDLPAYNSNDPLLENPFEVGTEFGYYRYREPSLGVKFDGPMVGVYGILNYRLSELESFSNFANVLHFDVHFNYSNVHYTGDGSASNISDFILEPRIWLGKDFRSHGFRATPYAGFGFRYLYDSFGKVDGGYDRISHYLYIPVGVELALPSIADWHVVLNPEFDIFVHGWQDSQLGKKYAGYPNMTNDQKRGYGARGSVTFWKQFDSYILTFTPYVRYWNIKDSETVTKSGSVFVVTGLEPANNTLEVGGKLGVAF